MVTLHEVITFLVSMQISISSLQTHNVNRCGRSRHLARKLSLRRKRSSPNVFEMAATETITSIILIKDRKSGSAGMPRSEERFSRNAETELVCRLLLEKKIYHIGDTAQEISNVRSNTATGDGDIYQGIDKAKLCTLEKFWKAEKRHGIG